MSLIEKLFGTYSDKELKKINPLAKKVLDLEPTYAAMSDSELQAQTPALKARLANGETLDDILPDAFAVCREAAWRVLGMKHFPVQITGGIALHRANIAEMQTGEGKTLVATLPAYLNALSGEGVHVVTVNDYLAKRDSEWMGKLYRWLGLSVGLIVPGLDGAARRKAYNADITYGTNNEFGFDYLRDNMVTYKANSGATPTPSWTRWTPSSSTRPAPPSSSRAAGRILPPCTARWTSSSAPCARAWWWSWKARRRPTTRPTAITWWTKSTRPPP